MSLVLQVMIQIKPENVDAFMEQVKANAVAARAEASCRQFDVLVDPEDATRLMLFEIYDDEKAFAEHQKTPAFQLYLTEAVPLLASRERKFWKLA